MDPFCNGYADSQFSLLAYPSFNYDFLTARIWNWRLFLFSKWERKISYQERIHKSFRPLKRKTEHLRVLIITLLVGRLRALVSLRHFRCHRNYWYCTMKWNLNVLLYVVFLKVRLIIFSSCTVIFFVSTSSE